MESIFATYSRFALALDEINLLPLVGQTRNYCQKCYDTNKVQVLNKCSAAMTAARFMTWDFFDPAFTTTQPVYILTFEIKSVCCFLKEKNERNEFFEHIMWREKRGAADFHHFNQPEYQKRVFTYWKKSIKIDIGIQLLLVPLQKIGNVKDRSTGLL